MLKTNENYDDKRNKMEELREMMREEMKETLIRGL